VLAWTEEAVDRLQRVTEDVVLTDLPLVSIRRLSDAGFVCFRSVIAPQCRLSLRHVVDTAEQVNDGLASLAAARGLRFVRLKREWYGADPIHIRPSLWRPAWQTILCGETFSSHARQAWSEGLRLYFMRPHRQWLCGVEQMSPQAGLTLTSGGRVWLY
jgi:hypothetical protein